MGVTMGFTNFITRSVDKLMDGTQEYRFISFNDDGILKTWKDEPPVTFEMENALSCIAQMGGTALRCYCISIGDTNAHVIGPNTFSEDYFAATDKLIQLADQYGVRLIFVLVDMHSFHVGGVANYEAFRGQPSGSFFYDSQIMQDYKDTFSYIANRVNTFTGVAYKDDPTILAWETGNELWEPPTAWTNEMSAYIKSVDPNHLVVDGNHNFNGINTSSLADPNIDIISRHYYPDQVGEDFATACNTDRNICQGYKAFVLGEFGQAEGSELVSWSDTIPAFLDALIANGTSGAMVWALRSHYKAGGFIIHTDLLENYRWPGFSSGDVWQETYKVNMIRDYAFLIRGLPVSAREIPVPPTLLPIDNVHSISWQGSAGAETYDIQRAGSENGPWATVGLDVIDSMITGGTWPYNPFIPFNDETAAEEQSYYYRAIAKNIAGESAPSNVVGPIIARPPTETDNLVVNPSFEDGDASWLLQPGWSISSAESHTGTSSAMLSSVTNDWYNIYQLIDVLPNTDYAYSFWGKCSESVFYAVDTGDWSSIISEDYTVGNNIWTLYSLAFNSGNNTSINIRVSNGNEGNINNSNPSYFDDFEIIVNQ